MLGLAKFKRAPLPARLDLRGLRRPAGPPAARELLGPRQPDRPARRLRRGQALRRGADDGLPPPAGRRHGASSRIFNTYGAADAPARRPRDPDLPAPGAPGQAADRVRRRQPDPQLLLRRRPDPRLVALAESDVHMPVNIGNPDEFTLLELAEAVIEVDRLALGDRLRGAADRRPPGPPARHHPRQRAPRLGAQGRSARRPAPDDRAGRRRATDRPPALTAVRSAAEAGIAYGVCRERGRQGSRDRRRRVLRHRRGDRARRRPASDDYLIVDEGDGFGGTWHWNTLSRRRRRHPVVQLPVLVRAAHRLVARVRARRRSCAAYAERLRRPATACATRGRASARGSTARRSTRTTHVWRLATTRRRGAHRAPRDRRDRRPHPAEDARTSRASTTFAGHHGPHRALGPRRWTCAASAWR